MLNIMPLHNTSIPINVWIVEDGKLLRRSLERVVNSQLDLNCTLSLESCEELFAALEAGDRPDLVLMDLSLPGASGVEATQRLRQLFPECPVIVLTVHDDDEHVFEAIRAGATGYLLKPSSPVEVVTAIQEARRGGAPINAYVGRRILNLFSRLPAPMPKTDEYGLSVRESEILGLVVDGLDKPAIAARLNLSYHTVGNHVRSVYRKLHVHSSSQAVAKAVRENLV